MQAFFGSIVDEGHAILFTEVGYKIMYNTETACLNIGTHNLGNLKIFPVIFDFNISHAII